MDYRIGYYPIKENEIKQIIKMVHAYYKKEDSYIEQVMQKNNVNASNKTDIYNIFEQCLNNKNNEYFDLCFGVCVAKAQKIYRKNFVIDNKSITELMQIYPFLDKYKTNLNDFIIFKNNKYKFINELKFPSSSGVYISYENVEKLYNDYYTDIRIRKAINTYYGNGEAEYSNKFIEIMDYCLKNNCGLLESNFLGKNSTQSTIDISMEHQTAKVTSNNNTQTHTDNTNGRETVSCNKMFFRIIKYRFLWEIVGYIISSIILRLAKVENLNLKLVLNFIVVATINIMIWKSTISKAFQTKTIYKEDIGQLVKKLIIFIFIMLAIGGVFDYLQYNSKINNIEKENEDLRVQSLIMDSFGTPESKEKYRKELEKAKNEVKKEIIPYYIGIEISAFIIHAGAFIYVKKLIEKSVEE